jgi:hypothetical protein
MQSATRQPTAHIVLRAGCRVEGMSYIHNSTGSVAELEGSDKSCAVITGMTKTAIDEEVKTRVRV